MRLVGYSNRLSVAPGETIDFMVSSAHAAYEAEIVRLVHGDPNPLGPGLVEHNVETPVRGRYPGRNQSIHTGSHITVEDGPSVRFTSSFTFQGWIFPTTPDKGVQGLVTKWLLAVPAGFALVISEGALEFWLANKTGRVARVGTGARLRERTWYFIAATFDAGTSEVRLVQEPCQNWPHDPSSRIITIQTGIRALESTETTLLIAALPGDRPGKVGGHYNGKIDRPRLFNRALSSAELERLKLGESPFDLGESLAAAWDFSREISSNRIMDVSPNANHGTAVNLPARAMTGANWTGDESNFTRAVGEYGAIYFHDDDLDDAGWETDFTFTIPSSLPSGIYAARLRAGADVERLPFVVRPARGVSTSRIAYLIPTFTYLAYANEHVPVEPLSLFPFADMDAQRNEYEYIAKNHLNSMYDTHSDGSGVRYASWKRPLVNMRPDALFRIYGGTERLSADLYLTHWLEQKGLACDTIADENLHEEGEALLSPYRVVVTGTHPEYWSKPMLDALDRYVDDGGRVMYLGGNGFYWVTGVDPERPHVIEVRRWRGTEAWEADPGEVFLSTTGEQGGLWRHRNRAPQKRLGVGFTAQGNDVARPYVRQPDSYTPQASFIFDGVKDGVIGDFRSLMLRHGAAGYEIDRADVALGTPSQALILATATGFSDSYQHVVEEILSTDNERGGTTNPLVRADIVYFEGPDGGAVFSVGSIAWCAVLSYNDGDNDVSRITENVLRHFAEDDRLPGSSIP